MLDTDDGGPRLDLLPEEAAAIAEHEKLSARKAVERAAALLGASWGRAALCQMIRDNIRNAQAAGRMEHAEHLEAVLKRAEARLGGGYDRRRNGSR
jgi:hypothetical protein